MSSLPSEQRQKLKQKYSGLYESFVQLLAEEDLMNLVRAGAPYDEYELEVDMILLKLNRANTPYELGQIIYETFVHCFGTSFASRGEQSYKDYQLRFEVLGELAWNIWSKWREGQK